MRGPCYSRSSRRRSQLSARSVRRQGEIAINWEAIGAVGEVAGAVAVLVTLVYVATQIRQNTQSTRAMTYWETTYGWQEYLQRQSGGFWPVGIPDRSEMATERATGHDPPRREVGRSWHSNE
jgi:hypothetical protein